MSGFLNTIKIRLYTFFKIPLINYVKPQIININNDSCEARIPLFFRTKNHLGTMYFGALSIGADMCIGVLALHHIDQAPKKIKLVFKDFKTDFIRLAKSDVHFHCHEGDKVKTLVKKVIKTGKRHHTTINGYATTPKASGDDVVMEFALTLSLK